MRKICLTVLILFVNFVANANKFASVSIDLQDSRVEISKVDDYFNKWFDLDKTVFKKSREWVDELGI